MVKAMAKIAKQLTELIGNTPLLELTNYEKENEENPANSYVEFVSDNIEEIENLLTIIGKHVYNKIDGEYVKLIIE